jgi:hypothetical protein
MALRVEAPATTLTSALRRSKLQTRAAAVCFVVGTVLLATCLILHGDLPADVSMEAALAYIVTKPWFALHLGMMVSGLLWIAGFVALSASLRSSRASELAPWLTACALIGGLFSLFDYAVDGYAFGLADDWALATGERKADLLLMAETGLRLLYGTARTEIVTFYGLSFLLAGLAVALDGRYLHWLGAIGAVAGGAVVMLGSAALGGVALAPDKLVFVGIIPIEGVWLLVLGPHLWSRA